MCVYINICCEIIERTNKRELAERIQVLQRKKEHSKLSEEEELELAQKIIQQRKMEIQ